MPCCISLRMDADSFLSLANTRDVILIIFRLVLAMVHNAKDIF